MTLLVVCQLNYVHSVKLIMSPLLVGKQACSHCFRFSRKLLFKPKALGYLV
jgi:hypothetical protein